MSKGKINGVPCEIIEENEEFILGVVDKDYSDAQVKADLDTAKLIRDKFIEMHERRKAAGLPVVEEEYIDDLKGLSDAFLMAWALDTLESAEKYM